MPFNQQQLQAIQQRDSSLLVSAPAGSGKTKILVSRIVTLLQEGYDIFDFLVLTFTEAAGNEMKQRLSEELAALLSEPLSADIKMHLETQVLKLPHAYITNFHGFCNLLLSKYGYLIDIMPGFEINSDPLMLKQAVLQECLEQWVQDQEIQEFLSLYFPGYSFERFSQLLLSLDDISHSIHDFYGFIEDIKTRYYNFTSLESWPLFPHLQNLFYHEAINSLNALTELRFYAENNQLTDFYERPDEQTEKNQSLPTPFDALYDYFEERVKSFSQPLSYDRLHALLMAPIPRSYTMSWKDIDPIIKDAFTKYKSTVSRPYKKAIEDFFPKNESNFIAQMALSQDAIEMLLSQNRLLSQFQSAYQKKKRMLNQLDFADLETYAHKLLEPQYGIVDILYKRLKEIMVDEYQDTNQIQESLLLKISHHLQPEIPLFMVGDMKQSIYRFRQADPQIFLDKYQTFSLTNEACLETQTRRIDLVFNYRSSKIVLDSINYIFNQIMDKSIGGLDYYLDDSARLNYDYIGKENNQKDMARQRFFEEHQLSTDILIDLYDPDSSFDPEQAEAHMVAQKILELKKTLEIDGHLVDYKDIVVLMRSTRAFLTFKKVFDTYHIPNHIVLSQGLMKSNEVTNMIAFLDAINNPYNDIALLSILTQPYTLGYIDMETIAKLRMNHKDIPLYQCLQISQDPQIIQFLEIFEQLKEQSITTSPYDLIKLIYEQTEYPLFVSTLINGEQRKANLDLFLDIAFDIQKKTPYLPHFIETLKGASDYAPAQMSSIDNNAVKFMTIHKSKGLEFPVVFVAQTHKTFNMKDSQKSLVIDKQLGVALKPNKYVHLDKIQNVTVSYHDYYRNLIARYQLDESVNEEMRILYVALTRASHKLILTGILKNIKDIVKLQEKLLVNQHPDMTHRPHAEDVLLYAGLRKTNNYLSWILMSTLRHPHIIAQCLNIEPLKQGAMQLKAFGFEKKLTFESTEHAMFSLILTDDQSLEKGKIKPLTAATIVPQQQERYHQFVYPYDLHKPYTLPVTKLQELDDDHYLALTDDVETSLVPAADKGTLVHLLLSHLNFKNDNIEALIHQLYENQFYDDQGRQVLLDYHNHLQSFVESSYYQMIKDATHIYKEKSFAYVDKELHQIIHGIFDLVFVYQGQVYVLDYKTDRISTQNTESALIKKHYTQLHYYQKVLKDMYKQDVHAIVYYLHTSQGVEF